MKHRYTKRIYWIGRLNPAVKAHPFSVAARKAEVCDLTGSWDKARELYELNLGRAEVAGSLKWAAESHYGLGKVMRYKGLFADSLENLKKAESEYLQIGDRQGAVMAVGAMGGVHAEQGNYPEAIRCFQQKKEWAEKSGDLMELAESWGSLGVVYNEKRLLSEALDCYQKQLAITQQINDLQGLSIVNGNIGNVYLFQDNLAVAAEYYAKQKDLAMQIGDKRSLCVVSCNLGLLYKYQGQQEKAVEQFESGLKSAREIGFTRAIASIVGNLGTIYQNMGQWPKARENLMQQLEISQAINDLQGLVTANANLNMLEWLTGNHAKARKHIGTAIDLSERHGFEDRLTICLNIAAGQEFKIRMTVEAENHAVRALNLARKRNDAEEISRALIIISGVKLISGNEDGLNELNGFIAGDLPEPLKNEALAMLYMCTGNKEYWVKAKLLSENLYEKTRDIAFRINHTNLEAATGP